MRRSSEEIAALRVGLEGEQWKAERGLPNRADQYKAELALCEADAPPVEVVEVAIAEPVEKAVVKRGRPRKT
jgi:hypothetical protein